MFGAGRASRGSRTRSRAARRLRLGRVRARRRRCSTCCSSCVERFGAAHRRRRARARTSDASAGVEELVERLDARGAAARRAGDGAGSAGAATSSTRTCSRCSPSTRSTGCARTSSAGVRCTAARLVRPRRLRHGLAELDARAQAVGEVITTLPLGEGGRARRASRSTSSSAPTAPREPSCSAAIADERGRGACRVCAAAPSRPSAEARRPASADAPGAERRSPEPRTSACAQSVSQTVRVDIRKLDKLMNIVGELSLTRAGLPAPQRRHEARARLHRPRRRAAQARAAASSASSPSCRPASSRCAWCRSARSSSAGARRPQDGRELDRQVRIEIDRRGHRARQAHRRGAHRSADAHHPQRHRPRHRAPDERAPAGKPRRAWCSCQRAAQGNHVVIEVERRRARHRPQQTRARRRSSAASSTPSAPRELTRREISTSSSCPASRPRTRSPRLRPRRRHGRREDQHRAALRRHRRRQRRRAGHAASPSRCRSRWPSSGRSSSGGRRAPTRCRSTACSRSSPSRPPSITHRRAARGDLGARPDAAAASPAQLFAAAGAPRPEPCSTSWSSASARTAWRSSWTSCSASRTSSSSRWAGGCGSVRGIAGATELGNQQTILVLDMVELLNEMAAGPDSAGRWSAHEEAARQEGRATQPCDADVAEVERRGPLPADAPTLRPTSSATRSTSSSSRRGAAGHRAELRRRQAPRRAPAARCSSSWPSGWRTRSTRCPSSRSRRSSSCRPSPRCRAPAALSLGHHLAARHHRAGHRSAPACCGSRQRAETRQSRILGVARRRRSGGAPGRSRHQRRAPRSRLHRADAARHAAPESELLRGVGRIGGRLIIVLDVDAVLGRHGARSMSASHRSESSWCSSPPSGSAPRSTSSTSCGCARSFARCRSPRCARGRASSRASSICAVR